MPSWFWGRPKHWGGSRRGKRPEALCKYCRHCVYDYLLLVSGTYRFAVCQRNIVDQVIVDAGAARECAHWSNKE